MADKFLRLNAGVPTETEGTVQSTGVAEAGKIPALNSQGVLDETLLPPGIGADVFVIPASENLAAGDFVNIYNSGGAKCRKADASTAGKHAHGFVLTGVTSGNNATVYFEGTNNQVTGATPGDVYLSGTTPGGFTSIPPSGAGKVVPRLGIATSATSINAECGQHYILA